jgi:excinuclease ABC subunit C
MANRNAEQSFQEKRLSEAADQDTLKEMMAALKLPKLPERIECFDISTIQGTNTVASMVVFTHGQPDKARYRRFSMKTVDGQDDFASMREVLMRRYTRAIEENDLPDFVLIDGGKGQLGMATAVFKDLGIEDMPHAGIAKSRTQDEGDRSPERFFVPGRMNPIILPQSGPVVQLAARIRNEAHRFAITYHRKKRGKAALSNRLVEIPGIGPKRAKVLLSKLGSMSKVREATVEEIAALPGFSDALAADIHARLRQDDAPEVK